MTIQTVTLYVMAAMFHRALAVSVCTQYLLVWRLRIHRFDTKSCKDIIALSGMGYKI